MFLKTKIFIGSFILGLFLASPIFAAEFRLVAQDGDNDNIIANCNKTIYVMMDIDSLKESNAAQLYVDHNFTGSGETSALNGAGLYAVYGQVPSLPLGRLGVYSYTDGINNVSGEGLRFASIVVKANTSNIGNTKNLTIYFNSLDPVTSKIADTDSNDILTGVSSGSYTVVSGYCDTVPPTISPVTPKADAPAHPVSSNIIFHVIDTNSGIDITSLTTTLKQKDYTGTGKDDVPFILTYLPITNGYAITLNPINDLIRELKVDVKVTVKDMAGNSKTLDYSFNDLTCAQLGCFALPPTCTSTLTTTEYVYITSTEYISTCAPDCVATTTIFDTSTEFVTTTVTTTLIQTVSPQNSLMPIHFYLDNRAVEATIYNEEISTLSGTVLTVAAETLNLNETINFARLVLEGKEFPMFYDNSLQMYSVDLTNLVTAGFYQASLQVNYGDDKSIVSNFTISVLPRGFVNLKTIKDTVPFAGVGVNLQRSIGGEYSLVKSMLTDGSGTYGFVVPNGNYRLVFEAPDFDTVYTSVFSVENNVVNRTQTFIEKIKLLDPNITLGEKADYLAGIAGERGQQIIDIANNPQVEKAMQNYAAPIALGAAVAATAPALSLLNLISYLRFLFLQPILLLGMRRRKKWGTVYNSLTKMPVDLAVVRLLDANTNRVVQSRVTDAQGRYVFLANPGTYRIIVEQKDMVFPSKVLQGYNEDTSFLDIYHGEIVHVDEKYTVLSANIPLDPIGAPEKTPQRIILDKHWKTFQHFIASLSVVAGLVAFIILPNWWTTLLLVSQVLLYFLFKRIAIPKKPKSWGIVYDKETQKPVGRAIARLFSKQFNKLVLSEVTDNSGRYSFMVGPNEYYVTFEKAGYQKAVTGDIKIKEKDEVIKVDTGMERIK